MDVEKFLCCHKLSLIYYYIYYYIVSMSLEEGELGKKKAIANSVITEVEST